MSYQPSWQNGQEKGTGRRDAAGRYEAISDYLKAHAVDLPIKVLDFGAWGAYFVNRLGEDFDAQCTAVDNTGITDAAASVTVIDKHLTPSELEALGEFDVALCLNVFHHQKNWRRYFAALRNAAPILFVETAHPDETLPKAVAHNMSTQITRAMEQAGGTVLTETPGYDTRFNRPLWVIDSRDGS